jgi:hypothetical protein
MLIDRCLKARKEIPKQRLNLKSESDKKEIEATVKEAKKIL